MKMLYFLSLNFFYFFFLGPKRSWRLNKSKFSFVPWYLANIVYLLPFHQVSTLTSSSLTTACMTPITNPDKMWEVDLVWWHFCHEAPFCIPTRQLALVVVGGVTAVGRQQPLVFPSLQWLNLSEELVAAAVVSAVHVRGTSPVTFLE